MNDKRATGWKIPLRFCGAVIFIVGIAALFRGPSTPAAQVPPSLLGQARALGIDLSADEEGKSWKARIAAASSGFTAQADKDARLAEIVRQSGTSGRLDAACTAVVLIRDDGMRDATLQSLLDTAAQDCGTLAWGVFALHGMQAPERQAQAAETLTRRWKECHAGTE